jgi:Winged helix-turn helix
MRSASASDRQRLQRWLKAPTTPQRVARRSWIVLLALDGVREQEIAARVGVSRPTVRLWLARFDKLGVEGLLRDAPGRGRHASLNPAEVRQRLADAGMLTPEGNPVSLRKAARFLGVSASALWRAIKKVPPAGGSTRSDSPWSQCIGVMACAAVKCRSHSHRRSRGAAHQLNYVRTRLFERRDHVVMS